MAHKNKDGDILERKKYGKITVFYERELDGGGTWFGQDLIPLIKKRFGKVKSICEFCSGPGFIGFSLLANGLCEELCLVDVNPRAVEACRRTIKENGLESRATVYLSDGLSAVPKTEKWDLVVSNPPHFNGSKKDLIAYDRNWRLHRSFYHGVSKYLNNNGSTIFQENKEGSSVRDFANMIKEGGLKIEDVMAPRFPPSPLSWLNHVRDMTKNNTLYYRFYYIHAKKRIET